MRLLVLYITLLLLPLSALAEGSNLSLSVTNINEDAGRIRIALYNGEKYFGDETWAITIREKVANPDGVNIEIENLPAGRYAILAYHDRNRNRHFDHRMWLIPAEGYGLSNNPPVTEAVDFANGAFDVDGASDVAMEIKLNYCGDTDVEKSVGRVLGCWISLSP
jgi:uncharacterized protein (DUF2141 family)